MATIDYVSSTGIVTPDTSTIRTEVEEEFTDALGEDTSTDSATDIGRMIDAETAARSGALSIMAYVMNQLNPNYASGVFLDAAYALMGGERDGEERSTVTLTCTGVSGTIITSGSYVEDDDSQQWEIAEDATIGDDNTIDVSAWSVEYGEISAAAGTITTISTGITGWETVTNESAAIEGSTEQSDVSTRSARKTEIGANAKGNSYAVLAAINALEGVVSTVYRENPTAEEAEIDGVTIAAYASYVCVDGGTDSEIAEAYHTSKGGGNPYQGDEEEVYTDEYSGQEITVKFDRPTDVPIYIRISATSVSSDDPESDIKDAITSYADGDIDGYTGFMLGSDVSAFQIASAINSELSDIFITDLQISDDGYSFSTTTTELDIYQKASIDEDNITVTLS